MLDPVSIVGLTIAIFDQLLKLGERSAELTADIRTFTDVGDSARYAAFDVVISTLPCHLGEIVG